MSGITRVNIRETSASTAPTTEIKKIECSQCKLWDKVNQKHDERIGRIANTAMILVGALAIFLASNFHRIKGTIGEAALFHTLTGWPIAVPLIFSAMEDKLYTPLPGVPNTLKQTSDQSHTIKKIGIVATILYSLSLIPRYVATQLKNECLAAVISESSADVQDAVLYPLLVGFCAGLFATAYKITALQKPATTVIEKEECGRCKLLKESNQKSAESIRMVKKVGIMATALSSMIFIPKLMFDTYSTYLQIRSK